MPLAMLKQVVGRCPTIESATCQCSAGVFGAKLTKVIIDSAKPGRKVLRVVIADDTAAIRDSMSNLIGRLADVAIVGLAKNGTEALEMIQTLKPDVATLDIRMPGLSGIKVLEAISREQLPVDVIMLTGLEETEYKHKCLSLGAKHFFHKAMEFERVVDVLKQRAAELNGSVAPSLTEL
jgi:YesN/AraC family two-component response regulator